MGDIVVKSKFIPPRCQNRFWHNKFLWRKYKKIKEYPLMILEGGPGYGKTTTLVNFLTTNSPDAHYWYSIEEKKIDTTTFWINLVNAFGVGNKKIENATSSLLQELKQKDLSINTFIKKLINILIDNLTTDTYLILDNFHLVLNNESILESLSYFIESLFSSLHLVILSRQKVQFPKLSTWQVKGEVAIVKERDFILDQQQVEELISVQYDLQLNTSEIEKIIKTTDGWLLAIDLMARKLKEGMKLEEILSKEDNTFEMIFDYLKYEILDDLNHRLKEFLLKTAILKKLDVRICDQLLDIDNSQMILEKLVTKSSFIERIDQGQYRYGKHFHEALKTRTDKVYDQDELHDKAKKIYLKNNYFDEVLYHSQELEENDEIAQLAVAHSKEWLKDNEFGLLRKYLTALSEEAFHAYPLLLIYRGNLNCCLEEFELMIENYQQAKYIFQRQNNNEGIVIALIRLTRSYFYIKSTKGLDYFQKLKGYKRELSTDQKDMYTYLKIKSKLIQGEVKEADNLVKDVQISDKYYNSLKSSLAFRKGNLKEALKLIRKVGDFNKYFWNSISFHNNPLFYPILYHLFRGEVDEAQTYIWEKLKSCNGINKSLLESYLVFSYRLSSAHLIEYYNKEYIHILDAINKLSSPLDLTWHKFEVLAQLVSFQAFYGNIEEGIKYGKKGLTYADEQRDKFAKGILLRGLGFNYYFNEELMKAENHFKKSRYIFININNKLQLASSLMWLALTLFKLNKEVEFEIIMSKFLQIIQENSYEYLILKSSLIGTSDPNYFIPILIEARKLKVKSDYVNKLLNELGLSKLNRHPGYPLRVQALGDFKLFRGREEVVEEDWKRKKAKELFKLFLVNHKKLISRGKICNLLWADKAIEAAKRSFNVTLNALNKILEPTRSAQEEPYFIIRQGSSYGLNISIAYDYDVALFEKLFNKGKKADEYIIRINYYRQAINLYKGDLLPGDLYQDWITKERERFMSLFLDMADELLIYYYQNREYEKCIKLTDRMLEINKHFEQAYFYKMKSYNQMGQRSFAIKAYQSCKKVLNEELKINPNSRIEEYYRSITL
ncbi:BTAD domain-containing putative transcriptional regulator [Selenihalanaerobacter shriftii]|uniref:Transcriptional activator domain-containing protein n=1 Tax=Selenihalanaerobacter shriftii TaxID=142842 RepID=A0A1T4KFB1_9FIRM|nr:BTAD domain-containing putative transcriptional regulator [Selenihalanaerobacter shriftii]SJZ41081.1 transcriptional activator domain-containing protein [Selenihalanaerobacter shriftii]